MGDMRLQYQPQLANEPEYVQIAIIHAGEVIKKRYDNHCLLATMQKDGYYILVVEQGMPSTLPCAVYSVVPQAGAGRAKVKQVFSKE